MDGHTVAQKPQIEIVGIACRTSNAKEEGPLDIPKLWGRFYNEHIQDKIPNKISNEIIALYCDYESDHTQSYTVVIGCPVHSLDDIPEGMTGKTIPASSYALFCATGAYPASLIKTWETIWQQSALERTYTGDFELYPETFWTDSPQKVEVYVATLPLTIAQ